jgi:hypothetical protein
VSDGGTFTAKDYASIHDSPTFAASIRVVWTPSRDMATIDDLHLRSWTPGLFSNDVMTTFLIRHVRWRLSPKQTQKIAL